MRRVRELFHREPPQEMPCPRCEVPAPPGTTVRAACGWDLLEAYRDSRSEGGIARDRSEKEHQ
jgi:hypothetical protein